MLVLADLKSRQMLRREYYALNRDRILASNRASKARHPGKHGRHKPYKPRTATCAECGLEVMAHTVTRYPRQCVKRKFVICDSCEQETRALDVDETERTLKRFRYGESGKRLVEREGLFLYSEFLEHDLIEANEPDAFDKERFDEIFNSLDERQRYVLNALFLKGKTAAQIGKKYNVTKKRIYQVKAKAIRRIRERWRYFDALESAIKHQESK